MKDQIFVALATGAALAAAAAVFSPPAHAMAADGLSQQTAPSGVTYIAGGVGQGQVDAMHAMRGDYNLRMTFARAHTGDYLADIHVRIEDMHGKKMVDTLAPGPLFYARLPDGTYRVLSTFGAQQQSREVTIGKGHPRELVLYFGPSSQAATTG